MVMSGPKKWRTRAAQVRGADDTAFPLQRLSRPVGCTITTRPSLCSDAPLAAAFEGAEVVACREFCAAAAEVHPGRGIRTIECAGGIGNFYGPSNPLNAVKGVGLRGSVETSV